LNFNRKTLAATAFLVGVSFSGVASAEITKMVGGAAMYPSKNIIQNAVNSKDNTTLVAAAKAAGLVDTLQALDPSRSSPRPTRRSRNFPRAQSIVC
jgi:uncharacterized surface protein with fasciclin (FAS1) repeats